MMSTAYTNRKGQTYYLCQGTVQTGKPHYYFAREPKGGPVEQLPDGYEIHEGANGLPFLAKSHPQVIHPAELTLVEAIVAQHPRAHNYRVTAKGGRIVISERIGADPDRLVPLLERLGGVFSRRAQEAREAIDQDARSSPVMRLILVDENKRTFRAERWCYSGSINGWVDINVAGRLRRLARMLIPKLGTHAFFDLY
jgi:hypothetical protein